MDPGIKHEELKRLRQSTVRDWKTDLKAIDAAIDLARTETARMGLFKLRGVIEAWIKEMQ